MAFQKSPQIIQLDREEFIILPDSELGITVEVSYKGKKVKNVTGLILNGGTMILD